MLSMMEPWAVPWDTVLMVWATISLLPSYSPAHRSETGIRHRLQRLASIGDCKLQRLKLFPYDRKLLCRSEFTFEWIFSALPIFTFKSIRHFLTHFPL